MPTNHNHMLTSQQARRNAAYRTHGTRRFSGSFSYLPTLVTGRVRGNIGAPLFIDGQHVEGPVTITHGPSLLGSRIAGGCGCGTKRSAAIAASLAQARIGGCNC